MSILKKSKVALDFYEGYRARNIVSGFEKFVLTDGESCLFVNSDYEPIPGEVVFKMDTRNHTTGIQVYKPRPAN